MTDVTCTLIATLINKKRDVHGKHKVHMNYLENCQCRYHSNQSMGRTRTDGFDEFESLKFDCIRKKADVQRCVLYQYTIQVNKLVDSGRQISEG